MEAVGGIAVLVAALIALAAAVAIYRVMSRALRDEWRRIPPARRGVAWLGTGTMVIGGIGGAVLLIVQPWGTKAAVWVILGLAAATMLVWVIGVFVQAVIDGRRARKLRSPNL